MDTMEVLASWQQFLGLTVAERTAEGYFSAVQRFLSAVPVMVVEVTEAQIVAFLDKYKDRPASQAAYYYALRHLFRFAKRRGYREDDPTEGLPAPKEKEKVPVALTVEELRAVVEAAFSRQFVRGLVILLLFYTGCRLSEAGGLRWDDIHGDSLRISEAKGGRERWVPISLSLNSVLEMLRDFDGTGFIVPVKKGTVWLWLKQAGQDAGLTKRVHPHLMRSTFASVMGENPIPPRTIQVLLGHRKLATTQRYLAVHDESRKEAVGVLPDLLPR